jgi:hypothetical protein
MSPDGRGLALGAGGLFLGPPIVHWAHRETGKGFLSLAAGPLLAVVGSEIGGAAARDQVPDGFSRARAQILGAIIGAAAWVVLDASLLAYEEPRPSKPARAAPSGRPRVVPAASVGANGAALGLAGTF